MEPASILLAGVAGVLSTLSPCVLPILPAVLAGARSDHRFGPWALAGGLALSFTVLGLFIATIGFTLGLDPNLFRYIAGATMIAIGGVLLVPAAQMQLAAMAGPVQTWTEARFGGLASGGGLRGPFGLGLLLGAVWTPCVGPTLGAASLLAAQGEHLFSVALTMLVFGLGAALPIVLLAMISQGAWKRFTSSGRQFSAVGKPILGGLLVVVGVFVLTGIDKQIETWLVDVSPAWLTALTTAV
jgi:cytochrome c-type biogenesis protein